MMNINRNNEQLRRAHQTFAAQLAPELFLTLATNRQISLPKMKRLTRQFLRDLDRKMLGNKFYKKGADKRMDGLLYVEHMDSNIHVHGLMTRPYCNRCGLQLHADAIWQKLCPSGSVVIADVGNVAKRSEYVTKEAIKHDFFKKQFFTASEFMAAA